MMAEHASPSKDTCPECGGKIDAITSQCKWCGFNISQPKSQKSKKWIWILLFILLISLGGAGVGYYFIRKTIGRSEPANSTQQSSQEQQRIVEAALAIQKLRESSIDAEDKPSISILQALQKRMIELKCSDIPFQSSRIRFQVLSLRDVPMQIRIDPGLRIYNPRNGSELVTLSKEVLRLLPKSAENREVLSARLKTIAVSGDYRIEEMNPEHPVTGFVQSILKEGASPSWNVLQIAVWVLNQNVDLETVRRERIHSPESEEQGILGATYPIADSIGMVDRALGLLEKRGTDITKTQLYKDAEKTLALATEAYQNSQSDTQNLETIGFFRNRSEARTILCEVFSRHPNAEGLTLRKTAFRYLVDIIIQNHGENVAESQRVFEVLSGAIQHETDEWLKQDMTHELEKAKKALTLSLVTKENP